MNDVNNSQGSATGGNTATGNPQDIGGQTIFSPNQSLQSGGDALLGTNGSSLTLTDPNGNPVKLSAPVTASVTATQPASSNHNAPAIIGIATVIIVTIVAVTWFISKSSNSLS